MSTPTGSRSAPLPASREWLFALLGGLVAWMLRLVVGTTLVRLACTRGVWGYLALWGTSLAGLAVAAAALVVARRLGRDTGEDGGIVATVAHVGVLLNSVSLLLIAVESLPIALLDPCA